MGNGERRGENQTAGENRFYVVPPRAARPMHPAHPQLWPSSLTAVNALDNREML